MKALAVYCLIYVQCFLSGLALYNKCKDFCAEFIADMDSF